MTRIAQPEPAQTQLRKETAPAVAARGDPRRLQDPAGEVGRHLRAAGAVEHPLRRRVVAPARSAWCARTSAGVAAGGQVWAFEDPGLFMVFGVYLQPAQARQGRGGDARRDRAPRAREGDGSRSWARRRTSSPRASCSASRRRRAGAADRQLVDPARRRQAWLGDYERYQAVTAEDVQRVARGLPDQDENLTLVVIPPQGEVASEARARDAARSAACGGGAQQGHRRARRRRRRRPRRWRPRISRPRRDPWAGRDRSPRAARAGDRPRPSRCPRSSASRCPTGSRCSSWRPRICRW